jgi:hypothetical protein
MQWLQNFLAVEMFEERVTYTTVYSFVAWLSCPVLPCPWHPPPPPHVRREVCRQLHQLLHLPESIATSVQAIERIFIDEHAWH